MTVICPSGTHNNISGGVMQIVVIRALPELKAIKDERNNLLAYSASHVPCLQNEYLTAW
jgi:hypothetical protein